jgi:ribonuclease Z
VLAPPGFARFVRALEAAWAEERALRLAFERRPNPDGFAFALDTIAAGETRRIGALEVTAVAVDHRPVEPALGFVLRADGRTLALSGDTRPAPALIAAAAGCDLLVHEVFVHDALVPVPGVRDAATIAAAASYHTLASEVGKVAQACAARGLVLTHLVPPEVDPRALLAQVRRDYAGPVVVGEDLLELDLADGTIQWRGLTLAAGGS